MGKIDTTIGELIGDIKRGELRLPELQRKYRWPATRVRDLLDSLYKGYPSGTILVWDTSNDAPARDLAIQQDAGTVGNHRLLLDGQQRLTSLYAVIKGQPILVKGRSKPIQIAFNLDHPDESLSSSTHIDADDDLDDSDFEEIDADDVDDDESDSHASTSISERLDALTFVVGTKAIFNDPKWLNVTDIFDKTKSDRDLLRPLLASFDDPRFDKYSQRIQRVRRIEDYPYVMQVLERDLTYEQVADIFVRVNSLGMKLRGTDLALAQITAKWQGSLTLFETFSNECEKLWPSFDPGLLVRCLVVFATEQSKFGSVGNISVGSLEDAWRRTQAGLRFALNFLHANAGIEDRTLLSSPYLVVPIAVFGERRNSQLTEQESRDLLYWFFLANATSHYSTSTETVLDADLASIMKRDGGPAALLELLLRQAPRSRFTATDFAGATRRNALFFTAYIAAKRNGAKDWNSGLSLSLAHSGRRHEIQTHHIFPQAIMKHRSRAEVNEIANLAFISGGANRSIGKKPPSSYFPAVIEKRGLDALRTQAIPADSHLWEVENFGEFLAERRSFLAAMVNEFLDTVEKGSLPIEKDLLELISDGEGARIEFKESLRFNTRTNQVDKALESVVVKTIAGFLNAHGGTLLIGVADSGDIAGIDRDLRTFGTKASADGFELHVRNLLNNQIGKRGCALVSIRFQEMEEREIAVIEVPASTEEIWVDADNGKTFYIRSGNSTQPLEGRDATSYIRDRFR